MNLPYHGMDFFTFKVKFISKIEAINAEYVVAILQPFHQKLLIIFYA